MWEQQYLDLIKDILENGEERNDRTGTGTVALFGKSININLAEGFPAITTKKLAWKSVVSELLWFIEGSNDERRLAEILHGTRDSEKKTIWTDNANADYWKPKAKFDGDLGRVYGVQWRHWRTYSLSKDQGHESGDLRYAEHEIDQLAQVIDKIKNNPTDRRIILSAWNVGELDQMALPPCHMFAIFNVSNDKKLSCMMTMRSSDVILGLPFNIASYALLTHMIAQATGLKVGRLIMSLGDTHIYSNHISAAKELLMRKPLKNSILVLNREIKNVFDFKIDDINLENYVYHDAIKLPMAI